MASGYRVQVALTDGKEARTLAWIECRPEGIYSGAGAPEVKFHSSYHKSGRAHVRKEGVATSEPPGVGVIEPSSGKPLSALRGWQPVSSWVLAVDDGSFGDYPVFRHRKANSTVYLDRRALHGEAVSLDVFAREPEWGSTLCWPQPLHKSFRLAHLDMRWDPWLLVLVGDAL
jgi:hypothetical protein